jgi:type IV pilus assembly protein PilV
MVQKAKNITSSSMKRCLQKQQPTSGFTLLEVLITVLVLGIGLLGLAALQNASIKNNQSAFDRTQAVIFMDSMQEVMRAYRPQALGGAFNRSCSTSVPGSGIAGVELAIWNSELQKKLGTSACGEISCNANICEIKIQWDDSRGVKGVSNMSLQTRFSL